MILCQHICVVLNSSKNIGGVYLLTSNITYKQKEAIRDIFVFVIMHGAVGGLVSRLKVQSAIRTFLDSRDLKSLLWKN